MTNLSSSNELSNPIHSLTPNKPSFTKKNWRSVNFEQTVMSYTTQRNIIFTKNINHYIPQIHNFQVELLESVLPSPQPYFSPPLEIMFFFFTFRKTQIREYLYIEFLELMEDLAQNQSDVLEFKKLTPLSGIRLYCCCI